MKKDNVTPVRVYRDEIYEAKTKIDLKTARQVLQSVLNVWNQLELIPCTDIFQLILNPQKVYGEAVNQLAEPPVTKGRFQISKQAYINTLEIPIPDSLYRAAREARKVQFTNMPELWSISGDQIVLNETEAESIIDRQSIYASGDKVKLAEDLIKFVDLFNSVNIRLDHLLFDSANPIDNRFFIQKFGFIGGDGRGSNATLTILPDKLREWLSL